ncbi:cytochrome c [Bradyrhizobium elkanii]|uniref:c-type cytochrome n=1 Tax=Bradyrhizobium elkanii TaxID=29448 RepID=UPI0027145C7F|nr:cytochrome c [Bradyrhizobium elkanii]WLB09523.1 cytochrome c [Bradyrhizobium elkanii]WLB72529.1 cytochrome c [Bradyrhizobium elkanii]
MRDDSETLTVVDLELIKRRRRRWIIPAIILVLALVGYSLYRQVMQIDAPVTYGSDEDNFKYGSIGSDREGIPYWIWKTMPDVCGKPDAIASLGVLQEPGKDTPIGFSKRRVGPVEQVGPNCGLCHTGSVRREPSAAPMIYTTAPAQQLNLENYFQFLFSCGSDKNFTADNLLTAIEKHTHLSLADKLIYRIAVPRVKKALEDRKPLFDSIIAGRPPWGPGRVDTFNPYKVLVFHLDMSHDTTIGTADFMSIWNQAPREGVWLHWDGNNDSVDERNLSAAIGAGATPDTLDFSNILRIKRWILTKPAPLYPFGIDYAKAAAGKPIYEHYCVDCHDVGARKFGQVTPLTELNTDAERNQAFDQAMADRMNTIGAGRPWHFHRFRPTNGYANHPLDGIWLRGPFLHNGSVPTLRDLLKAEADRPKTFYRGNDVYDTKNLGFVSYVAEASGRTFYQFDTSASGNSNSGHLYGIDLSDADKDALLEYLKTL